MFIRTDWTQMSRFYYWRTKPWCETLIKDFCPVKNLDKNSRKTLNKQVKNSIKAKAVQQPKAPALCKESHSAAAQSGLLAAVKTFLYSRLEQLVPLTPHDVKRACDSFFASLLNDKNVFDILYSLASFCPFFFLFISFILFIFFSYSLMFLHLRSLFGIFCQRLFKFFLTRFKWWQ